MPPKIRSLPKVPTGIRGLDEITNGGLPKGRPTLVAGSAGAGKTLFAMEFLVRGALEFDEPGVFVSFEETADELAKNVQSLGFDLKALTAKKKIVIDHVRVERSEIEETGEYNLEGLFVRLDYAIQSIGAKRVVLDTVESLFAGLSNTMILRAELRRLFRWLKSKGVTAIVTGERGDGTYTRHGLEEYVSDCVILLDHRVTQEISTRRLRVVKYRGSVHGTNEYPFLIDETGITVLPITSLGLQHVASTERIASGIPRLDSMLGGGGYYRGSSVLVSGTAGSGKTSVAAHFANATCARGERVLYCAFEESAAQITRNIRSIGIDLGRWTQKGLLEFHAVRPTLYGLEMHLATVYGTIRSFKPRVVIVDPVNSFVIGENTVEVKAMLMRLVDFLKMQRITALFTSLTSGSGGLEQTDVAISSLIDTWILLRDMELNGERNRAMYILKSRGMAHSNQIREFLLTNCGIELKDVYVGPSGVLTGSARLAQEAQEQAAQVARQQDSERKQLDLERKRAVMEAQIAALRAEYEAEKTEVERVILQDQTRETRLVKDRMEMAVSRRADRNGH